MRSADSPPSLFLTAVISALLFWPATTAQGAPHQGRSESPAPALGRIRSMAEAQHEIVMLLIRKKEYKEAATEAGKIFSMNWPADQEPLLLKELLFLSDQFVHNGQPKVGLQLLDDNARSFRTNSSRVAIWKEKGYLYKLVNDNDKALDCFREARRLEGP